MARVGMLGQLHYYTRVIPSRVNVSTDEKDNAELLMS